MQKFNQSLYDQLPENIRQSGEIAVINYGTIAPYMIVTQDNNNMEGASVDLLNAISKILGIKIKHENVAGLPALILGIQSGRYDMAIGPVADNLERQKNLTFIDYAIDYASLAVAKGNPLNLQSYDDLCGKRAAVQSGTVGEKRVNAQSAICVAQGKPAIDIMAFQDQTTTLLTVRSNRADFIHTISSAGAYYVSQSKGELELVRIGLRDDFPYPKDYQGSIVAKDSPLAPVLLAVFQELFANGTYQAIMQKWGLEQNTLPAPGINLAN